MKTAYQEMVDSFDKLMYMIKTTAPHLQPHAVELRERMKAALMDTQNKMSSTGSAPLPTPAVKAPIIPPPK